MPDMVLCEMVKLLMLLGEMLVQMFLKLWDHSRGIGAEHLSEPKGARCPQEAKTYWRYRQCVLHHLCCVAS